MPIPQSKLDRLTELLVDQLLAEFEKAKADNANVDPRRLAAAQKLLEAANARVLSPEAEPVILKKPVKAESPTPDAAATADDDAPITVPAFYRTKSMRERARRLLGAYLEKRDIQILNACAAEDGADLLPERTTTERIAAS